MVRKCSHGAAKVQPSGTGKQPFPFNLIIYVKHHAPLCSTGLYQVCSEIVGEAVNFTTSGVSPTALFGDAS